MNGSGGFMDHTGEGGYMMHGGGGAYAMAYAAEVSAHRDERG